MGKLVRKTDTRTEESNLKTVESAAPVAAQGKSGRLVRTGTSQVEKSYTTTPASTTRTKETTQNGRVGSGSFSGGRQSSSDIGIGERVKNALSGAGKTYGAGFINATGTAYDALPSARTTQNRAFLDETTQQYETAQKDLAAMLEANRQKRGTWSESDVAAQQDIVEGLKKRYDAASGAANAQEKVADEVYRLADEVANSGTQEIEEAKRGVGKLGQIAVDAGVAGVQMMGDAALGALTGGSALAPMFARSAGGAAQEARQEGASLNEQLAYGLSSGTLSVATEKLSNIASPFKKMFGGGVLDKALTGALTKMNGNAAGKFVLSVLSEGGEEMVEDLVQPILKGIYNGKSIGENYSELELEEVLYDGLIGGILGGVGGGVEMLNNRLPRRASAQQTQGNTQQETTVEAPASAQERKEAARGETTLPTTENAQGSALDGGKRVILSDYATQENVENISRGLNDGTLSVDALDRIYRTNENEHIDRRSSADMGNRKVNAFQFDHPEVHQYYRDAASELLEELGYSEKGGEIIRKTSREAGDDVYTRTKRVASERIAQLLDGEGISYADIEKALNAIINNHGQENFAAAKRVELLLDDMLSNGYRSIYGENVAPNEAYLAAKQAIPGAESTERTGEELPIWDMAEAQEENVSRETAARNMAQVRDAATALGKNGSRALTAAYNETAARSYAPQDAVRDFYQVYNAALNGGKDSNTTAPDYIRMAAQNAGERDARLATQAKYFGENAQLVRDENWKKAKLTSKQSYALDALAKVTGTEIRFAESVADGQANAEYANGVITLALDAEDPVMVSAVHETVHRIRETAPEMYQELADFVQANMSEAGMNYNLTARETLYQTGDIDVLTEETVADAFGAMLEDGKVLEQFTSEHRSAAQRIHDALHDLLLKIKRALGDKELRLSENQKAAFRDLAGKVSEMETLFTEALKTTQGKTQGKESAANEGGEVRYSVKNIVGDSGRQYGIGVYLDSDLLTGLSDAERKRMVRLRVIDELSGNSFIAYDNGNPVEISIARKNDRIKSNGGNKKPVLKELYNKYIGNETKQEAVVLADELIEISKHNRSEASAYSHEWLDNYGKNNWDKRTVYLQDKNKAVWEATLQIANSADGRKILYDIDPIKTVEGAIKSAPATTTSNIAQNNGAVKTESPVGRDDSGSEFYDSEPKRSMKVKDNDTLKFLDDQKTITTYKTMQLIDGKLYPPMAARVNGAYEDASTLGEWEQAVEHPELIKNGNKFKLDKGKGAGSLEAAYNPYMHSSNLVLNDQFSGAYTRDNLVTVECEVPVSEENGSYHAQGAKDATGWHAWHTGTVAGQLCAKKGMERQVFLSRYIKPVRIVPDAEVAKMYKTLLDGTDISVPDNVVTPSLRRELEKANVPIKQSGRVDYEGSEERIRTKKYSLKEYTTEEKKQHVSDAISYFGKTYRWNETGYLTPNGTKLDFSGRHEGGSGGYRTVDHRDIRDAIGDDYGGDDYSGSMVQFMSEGNIRISPESGGIDLSVMPTKAQMNGLSDFISKNRGEVILDIDNENGQTVFSAEYPRGTHANKVLSDITAYFEDGTMPQVSELAQFYTRDNYSLKTREALDEYIAQYGEMPAGEKPYRTINLPKRTGKNKYVSQTIRTVLEAKATPDAMVPTLEDMVAKGDFSYDRYTDKQAVADAESKIETQGWQKTLNQWKKATKNEVSKEAMATGWALYNNAATSGDVETALDVLNDMVSKSRNAAQALQAVRLLKKQEPSAQLYGVQRSVENLQEEINQRYGKNAPEIKVDRELAEKFLNAESDETRTKAMGELYRDIGRQMPSRAIDKWNAWRYLAMLGNPRTHVRNIVGNAGFAPLVAVKNAVGAGLEQAANAATRGKAGRTKAILTTKDAETIKAAWNDYANIEAQALGEGKYSDSAAMKKEVEEGRVIFKTKPLESFRKFNSAMLDKEDMWFSKPHYAAALAGYCKANGITAEQIASGKGLEKARNYAIREAQKATYRDTNAFSQMVSELGRYHGDNKAKKAVSVAMEGVLPFRKTPANILVRGVEYSPIGMTKAITYDLYQVQKGNMEASEMLDHLSASLTGTGVLALGVYMASQGLLRGNGGDDEDKKDFDSLRGHQDYALELPNGASITLDWLAPEVLPLFVGANLYEQMQEKSDEALTMADLLTAISNVSDPLLEMSCLQSLNDLFDSVGYAASGNTSALASVVSSAATSYLTQAIPTLLGQIERTGESIRMTTYTDKNKWLTGDMQYAIGKASSRLPIGDYNQIPYIDAWGRTESTGNLAQRAGNNFLNPAYTSTVESSAMEDELERLYEATDDAGVLPERAGKSFTVNGERKNLTGEEYVKYATAQGKAAYRIISELTESAAYKALSDSDRAAVIEEAYKVADATGKMSVSGYQPDGKIAKAVDAKSKYGLSEAQFLLMYQEQNEVESLKDNNGETISYSKGLQIMEVVYRQSGLSDRQRAALFEAFNVPESIQHYNKALVSEKLTAMRRSAK